MRKVFDRAPTETYVQHLVEQRHAADTKWRQSGYRDTEAYELQMAIRNKLQDICTRTGIRAYEVANDR